MTTAKKNNTKTLVISILTSVFVFFICKFFVVDITKIDSLSMSDTLSKNKWVFVRPYTFLSADIKRNDIVQITLPFNDKDTTLQKGLFFKRIVALPGETIKINESSVLINEKPIEINTNLLHNYIIKLKQQTDTVLFSQANITEKYLVDDSCVYLVTLTKTKFSELKSTGIAIQENAEDSGLYDESVFPNNPKIKWNKDFFGPLYIPKQNDTIRLDTANIMLYKKLIKVFENNRLEIKEGKIFINQTESTNYMVKQNYYFVIGDNFDNSIDSRYWGFIPAKAIRSKLLNSLK